MSWKIIADSGCDFINIPQLAPETTFERVPLTLQVGEKTFVDDEKLDIDNMMATMYAEKQATRSACPSPQAYEQAYHGAENIIVITITGSLSGSHNSAELGKTLFLEHNQANIHIIDSLSASGEIDLIVLEINRLISLGLSFNEVVEHITAYQQKTKLLFVLAKVDNLIKNGRLNKFIGTIVGLLNIRMVGTASSEGKLELLQKARGEKKAILATYDEMKKANYQGGKVIIAHCNNLSACQQLKTLIQQDFPKAEITFIKTSGLCSFYGENEGILLGYETH
ncbi:MULTISPECIES: DegV family protein [unclassified Granulicatella]|uniref:DegV family protein n=1 Tax=unclassified Granulicatella TaxID=2630493 RepID=UPI0010747F4C|nr:MULTISPECIES: DegV family protein [unclassified Granulicatella]MBF0781076.1 DegV family protein [Granulicatella sp. 19428wC4_WM01]TFU92248.1 DegV family protein [Granulicatella sp. WM01]